MFHLSRLHIHQKAKQFLLLNFSRGVRINPHTKSLRVWVICLILRVLSQLQHPSPTCQLLVHWMLDRLIKIRIFKCLQPEILQLTALNRSKRLEDQIRQCSCKKVRRIPRSWLRRSLTFLMQGREIRRKPCRTPINRSLVDQRRQVKNGKMLVVIHWRRDLGLQQDCHKPHCWCSTRTLC